MENTQKLSIEDKKQFIIKRAGRFDVGLKKNIIKMLILSDVGDEIMYDDNIYRETFINLDLLPENILDFIFNTVNAIFLTELKLISI